ncbi:MAG: hypothetical protein WC756_03840 [Taibaiella sp.]|jgi:acyl carrier protein
MAVVDVEYLVFSNILANYPTECVEHNLAPNSNLIEDLDLSSMEIYYLGLSIEKELQEMNLPSLTDKDIMGWKTVKDIIYTIANMPGVVNEERPV